MKGAKDLHKNTEHMPVWFQMWCWPHLEDLKQQNKFFKGEIDLMYRKKECFYKGDLIGGKCYGVGTAMLPGGDQIRSSTWMNDQRHGISKCTA